MNYTLIKLAALAVTLNVVLTVTRVVIQELARKKMRERKQPQTMDFFTLKRFKEIYEAERKPYYEEARAIFNSLCKQGRMHGGDLVLLRKLLEDSLGSTVERYKEYKFTNEYHRIYVYMKSWYIDENEWKQIIDFLNEVYGSETAIEQN